MFLSFPVTPLGLALVTIPTGNYSSRELERIRTESYVQGLSLHFIEYDRVVTSVFPKCVHDVPFIYILLYIIMNSHLSTINPTLI